MKQNVKNLEKPYILRWAFAAFFNHKKQYEFQDYKESYTIEEAHAIA